VASDPQVLPQRESSSQPTFLSTSGKPTHSGSRARRNPTLVRLTNTHASACAANSKKTALYLVFNRPSPFRESRRAVPRAPRHQRIPVS
jgi:hypothetical protein